MILGLLDKENKNFKVLQLSLLTGFFIGLYSLVDGYGARVSLSPIFKTLHWQSGSCMLVNIILIEIYWLLYLIF